MFDINTIVNAAIAEAVNAHLTEVLQQHANIVAALAERIDTLEGICATQHEGMVAMRDRIAVLAAELIADKPAIVIDEARMVEALNSQEWFWEKLQNRIDAATEQAVDNHCSNYDHDNYDSAVSDFEDMPSLDDYVTRDEVRSEIEDVLNNATLSLSI